MTPKPSSHPKRTVPAALDDHVRIVPLFVPKDLVTTAPGILAPPGPELTYRGGLLMTAVQVFTAFWGQAWNATAQQSVMTTVNDFFPFIVASGFHDQLSQYHPPRAPLALGPLPRTP